ncbi:LysE family transporter [Shewanella sp. AS16]|uniref:LysE family translocator n=1 Tax=Shewanella sp. AS16 TaxID=2907625 RepID=UPI001F3A3E37|nr:LysE family transporter [Shewanella sp. AS16]MCE9687576.1 LysE family transporter [Shewanella sp. AS16]
MASLMAALSLVCVAAITPGPNNFIVMNAAAGKGIRGALPAISGVLLGASLLGLLTWCGVATLLARHPAVQQGISLAGACYLLCLAGGLLLRANAAGSGAVPGQRQSALPDSFPAIALFQFLNPKSLVLLTTLVSELSQAYSGLAALGILLALLLTVSCLCLLLWATLGQVLSAHLSHPGRRCRFDRLMGLLLGLPALYLLLSNLPLSDLWLTHSGAFWLGL